MRKHSLFSLVAIGFTASSLLVSPCTFAAKKTAKKKVLEIYAAMEPGAEHLPADSFLMDDEGDAESMPAPPAPRAPRKAAAAPSRAPRAFDRVPENGKDALLHRLRIIEALISRHSRAYDYRAVTTRELQKILSQLDAQAAPSATADEPAPLPPPAPDNGI